MPVNLESTVKVPESCLLCDCDALSLHYHYRQRFRDQVFERVYWRCSNCQLVFLQPDLQVSAEFEKERYEEHENDIADPHYRGFLQQLWQPIQERVLKTDWGLDFGSGPSPALVHLAEEAGYQIQAYDPIFQKEPAALDMTYDYLVSSEVVEHFCDPKESWQQLMGLVRPGGLIGILTDRVPLNRSFKDWPYIRDLTHVAFYSERTFVWLAEVFDCQIEFLGDRTVFLKKSLNVLK